MAFFDQSNNSMIVNALKQLFNGRERDSRTERQTDGGRITAVLIAHQRGGVA